MKRVVYEKDQRCSRILIQINLLSAGGFYYLNEYILNPGEVMNYLIGSVPWRQGEVMTPVGRRQEARLNCMFGLNVNNSYTYAGKVNELNPFTPLLNTIREDLSRICFGDVGVRQYEFNTLLINYYRDGNDHISMHSDSEKSLITGTPIASISLGEVRHFDIDGITTPERVRIDLNNGSLIIMGWHVQSHYKHGVPIQKTIKGPRLNLTFRVGK